MQELLMQGSSIAEWRQLLKLRVKCGKNGKHIVDLLECLCTWMTVTSKPLPEAQQCLGGIYKKGSKEKPSVLEWFEQASGVSARWLPWKQENSPSVSKTEVVYQTPPAHDGTVWKFWPYNRDEVGVLSWSLSIFHVSGHTTEKKRANQAQCTTRNLIIIAF